MRGWKNKLNIISFDQWIKSLLPRRLIVFSISVAEKSFSEQFLMRRKITLFQNVTLGQIFIRFNFDKMVSTSDRPAISKLKEEKIRFCKSVTWIILSSEAPFILKHILYKIKLRLKKKTSFWTYLDHFMGYFSKFSSIYVVLSLKSV